MEPRRQQLTFMICHTLLQIHIHQWDFQINIVIYLLCPQHHAKSSGIHVSISHTARINYAIKPRFMNCFRHVLSLFIFQYPLSFQNSFPTGALISHNDRTIYEIHSVHSCTCIIGAGPVRHGTFLSFKVECAYNCLEWADTYLSIHMSRKTSILNDWMP